MHRLIISCPDKTGLVAEVSRLVANFGGCIMEAHHHGCLETQWFFMRHVISGLDTNIEQKSKPFNQHMQALAKDFDMEWKLIDTQKKKRVVILASHASHCLQELLSRWQSNDIYCEIPCVISNHESLKPLVDHFEIPYIYSPVDPLQKHTSFNNLTQVLANYKPDVIVLARYMQILPSTLCQAYENRMINIHHSFLPSFVGANPYQKAYERGVKLIGATSHYVTEDLDEGPILEQDVTRVKHSHSKEDMVRLGKDVERRVLAQGLNYHLEDRVFVHGRRTVILD